MTKKSRKKKIYSKKDYNSNSGMLTSVWGPGLWHFLHTLSFNYPPAPTKEQKKYYRDFILQLQYILPCKHCRDNLKKNLTKLPLNQAALKNRESFSRWMFKLHELVNKMLQKKSGLTYPQIRERYEHFRSRCTTDIPKKCKTRKSRKTRKTRKPKEKGCTEPLYGKKSKCILRIVPKNKRCKTLKIDKKCIKKKKI